MRAPCLVKMQNFSDFSAMLLHVPDSPCKLGLKQSGMPKPFLSGSLSWNALRQINSLILLTLSLSQCLRVRTKLHADFYVKWQASVLARILKDFFFAMKQQWEDFKYLHSYQCPGLERTRITVMFYRSHSRSFLIGFSILLPISSLKPTPRVSPALPDNKYQQQRTQCSLALVFC